MTLIVERTSDVSVQSTTATQVTVLTWEPPENAISDYLVTLVADRPATGGQLVYVRRVSYERVGAADPTIVALTVTGAHTAESTGETAGSIVLTTSGVNAVANGLGLAGETWEWTGRVYLNHVHTRH